MEIKGKVHCLFEQSGTFKNEFIKLCIPAEDYDIQNNFGQTEHVLDLFNEIERAYDNMPSLFDTITKDDLIMAFFPCIYFCAFSQQAFFPTYTNYRKCSTKETYDAILKRNQNRAYFFSILLKLFAIVKMRDLRMIVENPWAEQTFLKGGFEAPTIVDKDRTKRGDLFRKPTAYWFIGCEPTNGYTLQITPPHKIKKILKARMSGKNGICSEERSAISSDYARNFICDWVIGKAQPEIEPTLFDGIE